MGTCAAQQAEEGPALLAGTWACVEPKAPRGAARSTGDLVQRPLGERGGAPARPLSLAAPDPCGASSCSTTQCSCDARSPRAPRKSQWSVLNPCGPHVQDRVLHLPTGALRRRTRAAFRGAPGLPLDPPGHPHACSSRSMGAEARAPLRAASSPTNESRFAQLSQGPPRDSVHEGTLPRLGSTKGLRTPLFSPTDHHHLRASLVHLEGPRKNSAVEFDGPLQNVALPDAHPPCVLARLEDNATVPGVVEPCFAFLRGNVAAR